MKRIPILTTLLLSLLALAACQKTDDAAPDGMVEIFAESMNGGDKVALDGLSAIWCSGDEIRINGTTATVERRNGHAYIIDTALQPTTNRALYPASLEVANWGTDNPVVTLPAYYHYRTDDRGRQVLDLPMAAYSTGDKPLQFKHLTGALYVTVKDTGATARTLQSVTVKSNKYALNGSLNVALDNTDLVAARTGTPDELFVTLVFDEEVTLATNESLRVMIPVRPVGSDNNFTIEVKSYESGQSTSYLSSKTQPSGSDHSLARNELGYAPMDIPVATETTVSVVPYNSNSRRYEIYSPIDFVKMTEAIQNGWLSNDATYHLMCDIDMNGSSITTINNDSFRGKILGNNHIISNLTINGITVGGKVYCGLLKMCLPATEIKNITFENLSFVNESVGTLPLYIGAIEACNSLESNNSTQILDSCTINVGALNCGGATGNVYFGGLVGYSESKGLNFSKCHVKTNNLTIRGNNIWFGGFCGYNGGSNPTTITSSSWIGEGTTTISVNNYLRMGGMIGQKGMGNTTASNCYISGEVVVQSAGYYIGYLIGQKSSGAVNVSDINYATFNVLVNGSPITVNQIGNQ